MTAAPQERLILYGYDGCYYCQIVKEAMAALGILPEDRNVLRNPEFRQEVVKATGRGTVPVLRIEREGETVWMPESRDIIAYLQRKYADAEDGRVLGGSLGLWLKVEPLLRVAPWVLLIGGGIAGAPWRVPAWVVACGIMSVRSAWIALRMRAAPTRGGDDDGPVAGVGWGFHMVMAALFALTAVWIAAPI